MHYVTLSQHDSLIQEPRFIGPFSDYNSAQDYADDENQKLSLRGIPSWVASFYVTP
jgi:hypothetical protein